MKKLILTGVFSSIVLVGSLAAQEQKPNWKTGGSYGANFSQVGLKDWSGGGESSMSLSLFTDYFANYRKGKYSWDNELELAYGLTKQGDEKNSVRKSDDKIAFTTKAGRDFVEFWQYTALAEFKTQFAKGYKYDVDSDGDGVADIDKVQSSEFLAPAYLTVALGIEYKPNDNFFVFISPLSSKSTFVLDDKLSDAGAYGVNPGDSRRSEVGAYLNAMYKRALMENVKFQTKLNLFNNYKDPFLDISWQTQLLMKVNEYISASFSTHLIYDDDIKDKDGDTALQFKEVLAVGILYNF